MGSETLVVVREDIGATAWWARIVTPPGSQHVSQYVSTQPRFVGRTGGKTS